VNIEFMGLPGSGKTTVRRLLLEKLISKGLPSQSAEEAFYWVMRSKGDKLIRTTLKLLPHNLGLKTAEYFHGRSLFQTECQNAFLAQYGQSLYAYLGSPVFEGMSLADRQNVIGNYLAMGSLWQMLNQETGAAILFEEGFIQKSLMFVDHNSQGSEACHSHVTHYFDNIPLPTLAISIKTSTCNSYQRMKSREDGLTNRLKSCDSSTIEAFLKMTEKHLENITPILNKSQHCTVIEVSNDGSLSHLVDYLAQKIINHTTP